MKCIYCLNSQMNPATGRICKITNEKSLNANNCLDYEPDNDKIADERRSINSQEPFLVSDYLIGLLYKMPVKFDQSIEIKKSLRSALMLMAYFAFILLLGIILYFAGYFTGNPQLSRFGIVAAISGLAGTPLIWLLHKKGSFAKKTILIVCRTGIEINGELVKWDEYIGFRVEDKSETRNSLYAIEFLSTRNLKDNLIYLSDMPLSVKQLRTIIKHFAS